MSTASCVGGSAILILVAAIFLQTNQGSAAQQNFPNYPHETISNRLLQVHYYLPDSDRGYYRGTRFDCSGMISRVECNGHSFFAEFRRTHDPLNHDDVCGTAEEFGMTVLPPGFKEAKTGEPFVKIGVGVLERGEDPEYAFFKKYKVLKPGTWKIARSAGQVEFRQTLEGPEGWGYSYTKTVRLENDSPALVISRTLKNTGTKTIETDHYGHNFLRIDDLDADAAYALEFPFTPRFGERTQTQECVELQGNSLVFLRPVPPGKAVWTLIEGYSKPEDNRIKVLNKRTRASVSISTSLPLARLAFYSSDGVLSPEPFVKFTLGPGEEQRWSTAYLFDAPVGGGQR